MGAMFILAALGLGAMLLGGSKKKSDGLDDWAAKNCFDEHMPQDMRSELLKTLLSPEATPELLLTVADAAEASGYPRAAACVRLTAARRSASQSNPWE